MALVKDLLQAWHDSFAVHRVFGEPVERGNVTVIPVATVSGGGGGGSAPVEVGATEHGNGKDGNHREGSGGGFGGRARGTGVFVIDPDGVAWHPAVDVTTLGLAGIALVALVTLTIGSAVRRRRRP